MRPSRKCSTEEILPYIPDERIEDVIYFNPADTECPVSFNPLHLDEGEDIDIKVDENLTIFQRVLGDTGPRMEEILRQALYTLVDRPASTLLDIERLLDPSDPEFRKGIIRNCRYPEQAHFNYSPALFIPATVSGGLTIFIELLRLPHPISLRGLSPIRNVPKH